jgi:exodeoxyribonuclease VII small subunit
VIFDLQINNQTSHFSLPSDGAVFMTERKPKDEIGKLTFEQAIQQLKGIVDRIEQGEIPLQDSLEQYEKGMALIKHCRDILQKAEKRIEKISKEEPPEPEKEQEDSEPLLGG